MVFPFISVRFNAATLRRSAGKFFALRQTPEGSASGILRVTPDAPIGAERIASLRRSKEAPRSFALTFRQRRRPQGGPQCRSPATTLVDDVMRRWPATHPGVSRLPDGLRRLPDRGLPHASTTPAASTGSTAERLPRGAARGGADASSTRSRCPSLFGEREQPMRIAQHDALAAALDQPLAAPRRSRCGSRCAAWCRSSRRCPAG